MYRPVPSCKNIFTVPSRYENIIHLYYYSWSVPSRREIIHPLSRPAQPAVRYFSLFWSRFLFFSAKHVKTGPSRPVSNNTNGGVGVRAIRLELASTVVFWAFVEILLLLHTNFPDFYTCLLYTSPSPRDGLLSRMPSSA